MPQLAELTVDLAVKGQGNVDKAIDSTGSKLSGLVIGANKVYAAFQRMAAMAAKVVALPSQGLAKLGQSLDAAGQKMQKIGQAATKLSMLGTGFIGLFARAAIADTKEGDRLSLAFERLSKIIGQIFVPYVRLLTSGIIGLASWFSGLSERTKKIVGVTALLATGFAAVVAILPAVLAGLGALVSVFAFLATPIIAIPALILAVSAAILAMIVQGDTWEEKLVNVIGTVMDVWDFLVKALEGGWDGVVENFQKGWEIVKANFLKGIEVITENFQKGWEIVSRDFKTGWDIVVRDFKTGWGIILDEAGINQEKLSDGWDEVMKLFSKSWDDLWSGFQTGWSITVENFKTGIDEILSWLGLIESKTAEVKTGLHNTGAVAGSLGGAALGVGDQGSGRDTGVGDFSGGPGGGGNWGNDPPKEIAQAVTMGVTEGIAKAEGKREKKSNRERAKEFVDDMKKMFKLPKLDFSPTQKRMEITTEGLQSTFDRIQKQSVANMGGIDKQDLQIQKTEQVHQDLQKIIMEGVKVKAMPSLVV